MDENIAESVVSGRLVSIQEVVRLSGVTSRTLRHYDQIGLLTPAHVGHGGIRSYNQGNLLRLQQIMILRELDLALSAIKQILDGQLNQLTALRDHRERLRTAANRLAQIQQTVETTISNLEGNRDMNAAEIFAGFDAEKQTQYEAELLAEGVPQMQNHIDHSWARIAELSKDDAEAIARGYIDIELALTELLRAGAAPDAVEVQQVISAHHALVSKFWFPNAQAYIGLGDMYTSHPDFRARYDEHDSGLAQFFSDAMTHYANTELE